VSDDQRPPRFAGSERETVLRLWAYHRESFLRKLLGVTDEQARWSPVASGTSLLWLADHLADSQHHWLAVRFLGGSGPAAGSAASATVEDAIRRCEERWAAVDEIVSQHDFDSLCAAPVHGDSSPVSLRWVVTHLLEETARHAGHADILRELIDGSTGR
jgi:hypothetical protein